MLWNGIVYRPLHIVNDFSCKTKMARSASRGQVGRSHSEAGIPMVEAKQRSSCAWARREDGRWNQADSAERREMEFQIDIVSPDIRPASSTPSTPKAGSPPPSPVSSRDTRRAASTNSCRGPSQSACADDDAYGQRLLEVVHQTAPGVGLARSRARSAVARDRRAAIDLKRGADCQLGISLRISDILPNAILIVTNNIDSIPRLLLSKSRLTRNYSKEKIRNEERHHHWPKQCGNENFKV
jgi:hypothetical protein